MWHISENMLNNKVLLCLVNFLKHFDKKYVMTQVVGWCILWLDHRKRCYVEKNKTIFHLLYECATGPNCQCALLNTWYICPPLRACYTSATLRHIWPSFDNLHWFSRYGCHTEEEFLLLNVTPSKMSWTNINHGGFCYCNPLVNPV